MRFSTIACVLAVFAFGTHGYASLFSISANVRSPATWPTFVDARHAIKTVVQPLAQSPELVEQALSSLSAPSGPPSAIVAAAVEVGAAQVAPPLPVQLPSLSAIKTAWLPQQVRRLETPAPARRPLPAARPGTSNIVTGSIRRPADKIEPPVETSAGSRPAPSFDTATRSALGGPVPTAVTAVPRQVAATPLPLLNLLNLENSTSAATLRPVNIALPGRRPLGHRRPGSGSGAVDGESAGSVAGLWGEPVLRPLGQSLAVVRQLPKEPRPSRSTSQAVKTAILHPPLPSRMLSAPPIAPAPAADSGAASESVQMAAVAQQRSAASQNRSKVRRGRATARLVTRRAYGVPRRRAARAQKARQRSARVARRHYARNNWKRQALGDSLY